VEERHFPYFLKGYTLNPAAVALVGADVGPTQTVGSLKLQLNGTPLETWAAKVPVGNVPACDAKAALGALVRKHTLKVIDPGQLRPAAGTGPTAPTFDPAKLRDLLLYCEFTIQAHS
jgi:hypothetical protein